MQHHEPILLSHFHAKTQRIFFCGWGQVFSSFHCYSGKGTGSSDPTAIICPPLEVT